MFKAAEQEAKALNNWNGSMVTLDIMDQNLSSIEMEQPSNLEYRHTAKFMPRTDPINDENKKSSHQNNSNSLHTLIENSYTSYEIQDQLEQINNSQKRFQNIN